MNGFGVNETEVVLRQQSTVVLVTLWLSVSVLVQKELPVIAIFLNCVFSKPIYKM